MPLQSRFEILNTLCTECNRATCNDHSESCTLTKEIFSDTFDVNYNTTLLKDKKIDTDETQTKLGNELKFPQRGIHISNLNIRHLKPKIDDVRLLLNKSNNLDIFGVCETFLNNTVADDILTVNGYHFERKDRTSANLHAEKGGGILIYIGDHLKYIRRHDLESPDIESVWIEVKIQNSKSFLICSLYRPPSSKAEWFEQFSSQMEKSMTYSDEIYVMGDINIDIREGNITNTKWKHEVEIFDLHQLITVPTRVTAHSETLIDHVYVSKPEHATDAFVPCIAISDHYPVCFTRITSKKQVKRACHKSIKYRCFKKFNEEAFLTNLSTTMTNLNISQTDTDKNFSLWSSSVVAVLNKYAPMKTKRVSRDTQPEWFNDNIKEAIKNRDFNHKKRNWQQYKYWRNKVKFYIRQSKKDFFSKSITENKDNAYIWKHVKNLQSQTKDSSIPEELKVDSESYNDLQTIVNKLNSYFANISDRLKTTNQVDNYNQNDLNKLKTFIETKVPNEVQFNIPLMTMSGLINEIKALDITKATGIDGLSPKILKSSVDILSVTLLKMINISIHTGLFPECLKIAKLRPIYKGGPDCDTSNYRPISILPVVSKIIEKHVTKHLFAYLNKYQILHKSQSGFRQKHSCNTALIKLIDKWLQCIDKGEVIGAIFFDLRKAFDVVDHDILMHKLSLYKFDKLSCDWIKSYLSNRQQCIIEKEIKSTMQIVKSGVPQGSVLGPVLFLLFINDLPLFTNDVFTDIYADDTTMHAADRNCKTVEKRLQNGANGFRTWCSSNKMYINLSKTTQMTIGTRQNLASSQSIELNIEEEIIQAVSKQKLLGIIIDKTLSWDNQIDAVCLNITRRITLLKLLSNYVDKTSLNQYYKSYILPIFDFGCMIWGRCSFSNVNRLVKLQKRAARIILRADFMTPSQTMFDELQWLSFPKRVQYHTSVMIYKALNNQTPEYISELFIKTSDAHCRNLRSADNEMLRIPKSRTAYLENSFAISGAKLWNTIPLSIRSLCSLNTFKEAIKRHLLKH
ncbi:MAG: reverse transcriptase family protein [gamma proteobacterium symbiont of Lucinoma myriamae]|nr:reverse transcriptase family protein [gamma proteobacterium symbiont of Lucinoma myriamae]